MNASSYPHGHNGMDNLNLRTWSLCPASLTNNLKWFLWHSRKRRGGNSLLRFVLHFDCDGHPSFLKASYYPNFLLCYLFEMSVSTVATCNQSLQHIATFAAICNKVKKDPGKSSPLFPMEMVPSLSEQPFQCWLQLQYHAMRLFSFCSKWSFLRRMLSCSFSPSFSVLESAFEMLSLIYWGLQHCNSLQCFATK